MSINLKADFFKMDTQFITNNKGKTLAAILPIKKYKEMLEALDELEDIRLYDKSNKGEQQFLEAEEAFREIEESR
ncbi:MAG: hypothetical protein Kapaf2KO_07970 [Candidatus Kapaibacteriales bacterium]